jgi:pyranose oxidase
MRPSNSCSHPEFTLGAENVEQLRYNNLPIAPVVRSVGGMGSYWSCATPEQHPTIERSDIFSDSEWGSLYREAKAMFSITDTAFDHSVRHHVVKDALSRAHPDREFVNLPLACQRNAINQDYVQWTCSATIMGDLADPRYAGGNFELRSHHCCTGLVVDEASKRVVAAKLTDLMTKELVLVKAKKYVICAGAALGAGILYNSNIRPETGYPALVSPSSTLSRS